MLDTVAATGSYAKAARQLGLREPTVRAHLVNVRSRLGVRTTLTAYREAVQRGLLPLA